MIPDNSRKHARRSIRLQDYDYRLGGAYFVTICTYQQRPIFGHVDQTGNMRLNQMGCIVQEEWMQTPVLRPYTELDAFVIMPNHMHGILLIVEDSPPVVGATRRVARKSPNGPLPGSLGAIVGGFKSKVSRRINQVQSTPGAIIWQRNYHEIIIRNEKMLDQLRTYTIYNPAKWAEDRYYSE